MHPQENQLLKWSCVHAFMTGCMMSILSNVPLAMFLSHFSSGSLSYMYIANAGISLVMGFFYSFFLDRVRFSRLQYALLFILTLSTFLIWFTLFASTANWLVAVILALSWVMLDFIKLTFWSTLNRLYNLQQAKRLFGFIGGANSVAGIITGFSLPFLIAVIGTTQLLLIATITGVFMIYAFYKLKSLAPEKMDASLTLNLEEHEDNSSSLTLRASLTNRYFLLIFLSAILSIFANYSLEMLFNSETQKRYPTDAEMASFFAIFYAITDLTRFVSVIAFQSPLLKRKGVVFTILLQPLITLVLCIAALLTDFVPPMAIFGFWILSLSQLFFTSYSTGIGQSAFLILFQPLSPEGRSWIQSRVETVAVPVATALVGLAMLVADRVVGINFVTFLPFILLFNVLWILCTVLLKTGYKEALQLALNKPYLTRPSIEQVDRTLMPLLKSKLNSNFPEEIIFALNTLEKSDDALYKEELRHALHSSFYEVRKYAVGQVAKYADRSLFEKIRYMATTDEATSVRAACYEAMANSPYQDDVAMALLACNDSNAAIRAGAVLGLLRHERVRPEALYALQELVQSTQSEERERAAHLIGESRKYEFRDLLAPLLNDAKISVREHAILAAGKIGDISSLEDKFKSNDTQVIPNALVQALVVSHEPTARHFISFFAALPAISKPLVLRASGFLSSEESKALLVSVATQHDTSLRHPALLSLTQRRYQIETSTQESVKKLIAEDINTIRLFRSKLSRIIENEKTLSLRALLERNIVQAQERLFAILSFVLDYSDMAKIKAGFLSGDEEQISYALELLERVCSPHYKAEVLGAIEKKGGESKANPDDFKSLLTEILENKSAVFNTWICVAAIFYIGEVGLVELRELVKRYQGHSEQVLDETAKWALRLL